MNQKMTKKPNNPKQRLIFYPNKERKRSYTLGNNGMFCKTLGRAKEILRQRPKEYLSRAVFYNGDGIASELI